MSGHLRKLVDHLTWADAAVLAALRSSPGSDPRALALFAHVVAVESVWLARVAGRPADIAVWPTLSVDEAAARADRNARELEALLASLGPADLSREIEYRNTAGQSFRSSIEDILLHVALHGTYHRGQVALVARGGGGEPASTDYIGFVRGVPAARTVPSSLAPATR